MLIDSIILAKTKYKPTQFTGGGIQISTSKHTKQLTIKLVMYFGYNLDRNPISAQIRIQEKDVNTLSLELLLKSKSYINLLQKNDDILDLDLVRNERVTTALRDRSSDNDSVDSDSVDSVDSDRDIIQSEQAPPPYVPTKKEVLKTWNDNATVLGLPLIRNISETRYKKFKTRISQNTNYLEDFLEVMEMASVSNFIMNGNWFTFDWLIANNENYLKVLEGNYTNKGKK